MYSLRDVVTSDLAWLYELNRQSYEDVVVEQFGEWDDAFQREMFSKNWNGREAQIIIIGGVDSGVLSVQSHEDFNLLVEIQLLPQHRSQGIGTMIIEREIAKSRKQKKSLQLQVLHKNTAAQRLYYRLGFTEVGISKTHYRMEVR